MKGKRKHKGGGGGTGGANEAEQDLKDKPKDRTEPSGPSKEAEEMKKGGRTKKARGGKTVGVISGPEPPAHAGRKPRASGGRAYSDKNPFTSANVGKEPKGHKTGGPSRELEGMDSGKD
jgi:hypothetical protein